MRDVLAHFKDAHKAGAGWAARCPAHDDGKASLSIGTGDEGRTLLHCHAGCKTEAIVESVGLTLADLHPATATPRTVEYNYRDESGALVFQVVRFEPKDFRQRRPDGTGGWIWNMKGVAPLVYRLDELTGKATVLIAEGEKDVDRLWSLGLPATCNHGGAGKWKAEQTAQLKAAGAQRAHARCSTSCVK